MQDVVIGGGIAGLAAAHALAAQGRDVLLLEGAAEVGGKLRLGSVAGVTVDVGAEAMLNRRPEAVDLARSLGLDLVHPATSSSLLWTRDALRPLPRSVLGVPADLAALASSGVLSDEGLDRARHETVLPLPSGDVSVADLVGARLGPEVVDRLVEPLLGGVYAGHATSLSARATVPQVVALLDRSPSLLEAAAAVPAAPDVPVFAGLVGGVGRLAGALAATGAFSVRTGATVRELRRTTTGFALTVGSAAAPEQIEAERVVVAVPPAAAARLLADVAPTAAAELAGVETASMAIVTLAFRAADLAALPAGSGFLVPPVDGHRIKAATFSFAKWDWVREAGRDTGPDDVLLLRTSLGRHREEAALQVPDEELVAAARADLVAATGVDAAPVDAHVQRWGGALPQYAVGHLDRVARIRADVARASAAGAGALAVCGATYEGIGIPACIASAHHAVDALPLLTRGECPTPACRPAVDVPPRRDIRRGSTPGCGTRTAGRHNEGMTSKAAKARELNDTIRYTMWSVFRLARPLEDADRAAEATDVEALLEVLAEQDVVVRGVYDVSGLRADADVMIWWHAATSEQLQDAYNAFRRTTFGRRLDPVWSQMALHRPAEFNKSHIPAFLADEEARAHICVYPFVRSYEWYLLDDAERRRMLSEHGKLARDYTDVRANTVASFALGDYEWMLAFEADELHRIVDLMRHLRASDARRHVREEVPFYTGARTTVAALLDRLP